MKLTLGHAAWRSLMSLALLALAPACKDEGGGSDDEAGDDADSDGTDTDTGGEEDTYVPPPGGMRRLLDYQYLNSIELMFGPQARAVAGHPVDLSLHGYTSIGSSELAPALDSVELYEASALAVADAAIANPSTMAAFARPSSGGAVTATG